MRVALAQINPLVGDVVANTTAILRCVKSAASQGTELVVFSELAVVGYPPRDLLDDPALCREALGALETLAADCRSIAALVGVPRPAESGPGAPLLDAAALLVDGVVREFFAKSLLPNYSVYDDPRYFRPGPGPGCVEIAGCRVGVTICEDIWDAEALGRQRYDTDPIARLMGEDVDVVVNLSASGYERGKAAHRERLLARQARRLGAPIVYVNQVGGNDEMIFDGGSFAVAADGELLGRAASFREDLLLVDTASPGRCEPLADEATRLIDALVLGIGDHVRKADYAGVVVHLNGGLNTAVVTALAVRATGPKNVTAVPVGGGRDAASGQASRLGIRLLQPGATVPDDALVLWSASKTDLALGRCASGGGLAPIGDLLDRAVVGLARQLGVTGSTSRRGPAADDALDEIVAQYVEQGRTVEQVDVPGVSRDAIIETVDRIDRAERYRRTAPPVLHVSDRAFGLGRRMPIACRTPRRSGPRTSQEDVST